MLAYELVTSRDVNRENDVDFPEIGKVIYTDDIRAAVIAKFRNLADRLETGELQGARVEWNDSATTPKMVTVEVHPGQIPEKPAGVYMSVFSFKPMSELPIRLTGV